LGKWVSPTHDELGFIHSPTVKQHKGGSMRDALVFNGASNLDFQDIRTNVTRIPEVVARVREAQEIWDTLSAQSLDLATFIASEDSVFLGNIKLKNFATAVVQVGLLDRYLKSHKLPEFVMGAVNGDSALMVALGKISFHDMIADSPALGNRSPRTMNVIPGGLELPVLSGVELCEYGVFRRDTKGEYERMDQETREADKMVLEMVETHEVRRLVMVGPGNTVSGKKLLDMTAHDIQVQESIDMDPMLSWFWSNLKDNRLAIAN